MLDVTRLSDEDQAKRCLQCPSIKMVNGVFRCHRSRCNYKPAEALPATRTPYPLEIPSEYIKSLTIRAEQTEKAADLWKQEFELRKRIKMAELRSKRLIARRPRIIAIGLGVFHLVLLAHRLADSTPVVI